MKGTFGWFSLSKSFFLCSALSLGLAATSCSKKKDSGSSSSTGGTSTDSNVDGGTTDSGTTDGGTTDGGTTDTTVNIVGSLSLTSDEASAALRLTADPAYKLKCVTSDIVDMSACLGDITSGAFDLSCEGFKGKKFGCFIGELAEDGVSLNILGMITSDQLAASSSTDKVVLGITFDPVTGIAKVTSFEAQTSTGEVDTAAAAVAASVSEELKNLSMTSGTYDFTFCDTGMDRKKALGGEFETTDITDNCGHKERYYINFTAASETKAPHIELWNSESARNACIVDGTLTYSISDGTNTLALTADSTFDDLYQAIVDNGWASQAAIDRVATAGNSIEQKQDDMAVQMEQMFGTADFCPVLMGKILEGYDNAVLKQENGRAYCENITFDTGNADLDQKLSQDGPPEEWCIQYKSVTDEEKEQIKNSFIMECNLHVKGGGNQEELWAKRDLVEPFLRSLGEVRHKTGSGQFDAFKQVWEKIDFDGISARVEANTQTEDDDAQLAALCVSLVDVWYDRDRLQVACDNLGTAQQKLVMTTAPLTGRQFLVALFKSGTPDRQQLESRACDGEWEFDFRYISPDDMNASTITTFFSKLELGGPDSQMPGMVVKTSDSDTFSGIVTPMMTYLLGDGDSVLPKVFGCTAVQLNNQKQWMEQMAGSGDMGGFDPAQQMATQLYQTLKDAKKSFLIRDINMKDPNKNSVDPFATCSSNKNCAEAVAEINALSTSILAVIAANPEQTAWLLNDLCGLNGTAINDNGGFSLGSDTGLTCGGAVPQNKFYSQMFMGMGGDGSTFPQQWEGDDRPALDRLGDLKQRMAGFIGNEIARFDTDYADKLLSISKESSCLPDATLTRDPILGGANGDEMTFGLKLRAPVRRTMDSDVSLALNTSGTASADTKFNAAEERLEKEGGGMGSDSCVRGEVIRMSQFFLKDNDIYGTFAKVWKDDCFQSSDSESNDSTEASTAALTEEMPMDGGDPMAGGDTSGSGDPMAGGDTSGGGDTGAETTTDSSSSTAEHGWFAAFKAVLKE